MGSLGETGKRERASAMRLCFTACHSKRTLAPTTFSLSLCSRLLVHLLSGRWKNPTNGWWSVMSVKVVGEPSM